MTHETPTKSAQATTAGRTVDISIDINAPVEDVWAALSRSDELTKWLPTDAAIDGKPGGRYTISWEGGWEWAMSIDAWEPPKRLRLVDRQARPFDTDGRKVDGTTPVELVLEFTLESHAGRTTLRLVHSGFGHDASWDDEVDGVSLGWQSELRGLKHYLEHHRGRARHLGWARLGSDMNAQALWSTLVSPRGLVAQGPIDPRIGDRVRVDLVTGDTIEGPVLFAASSRQFLIRAENLGDSLFRIAADRAAGRSMAQVTLSSWTMGDAGVRAFASRVQQALDGRIGTA
jgi:uncharacterized protein YndB with AHSA1/START domain